MTVEIHLGDNLEVARRLPDASFALVYLDPPFNTGRTQERAIESALRIQSRADAAASASPDPRAPGAGPARSGLNTAHLVSDPDAPVPPAGPVKGGFRGTSYARTRGALRLYDDRFDDYWGFLEPRLREAWRLLQDDGTLYLHLDYREAHYAKVMLDAVRVP